MDGVFHSFGVSFQNEMRKNKQTNKKNHDERSGCSCVGWKKSADVDGRGRRTEEHRLKLENC